MKRTIKDLIEHIIPQEHAWKIKLLDQWHTIFGNLSKNAFPVLIKDTTLVVGVTHPIWAQELYLLETTLRAKINASIGKHAISRISFRITQKTKPTHRVIESCPTHQQSHTEETLRLNSAEQRTLNKVTDEQFKATMHKFLARCKLKKDKG